MPSDKSAVNCRISIWPSDEAGATAIEYALIAAGVALAISVVVFTLGDEVLALFQEVAAAFDQ